jgi:HlyD family secretion protein
MSQTAGENLERVQKLADKGGVPRVQVDDEAARVHVASHDVEAARSAVRVAVQQASLQRAIRGRVAGVGDLLELVSPIDGVVLSVPHEHGGVIMQGTPIVELGDPRLIEVLVPLRTADALSLPTAARVVVSGWGGADVKGTVRAVEPKAFTRVSALGVEEQRTNVVIDLDGPPPTPTLGDGFGVHVSIVTAEVQDAVRVPVGALIRRGDGWAVLVMGDGKAVERPVVVGRRASGLAEVKQGLEPAEVVVLYPGDRVAAGARVKPRD